MKNTYGSPIKIFALTANLPAVFIFETFVFVVQCKL